MTNYISTPSLRRGVVFLIVLFLNLSIFVYPKFFVKADGLDHLIISEVQITGGTANDEFIEIYNPTSNSIDLSTWSVQYVSGGSPTYQRKNFVSGNIISSLGYFLIAHSSYDGIDPLHGITPIPDMSHSSFSLNDDGGTIFLVKDHNTLFDSNSVSIVDKVAYGVGDLFPEGITATTPQVGKSIGRKWVNGYLDTDNNNADFEIQTPTPKAQNESLPPPPPPVIYSTKIYFNEVFPSPSTGEEWIEVANGDTVAVNLDGWTIEDTVGAVKVYTIGNAELEPDGFLVLYKSSTGIILNNGGDGLILKNPNGEMVDQCEYPSISSDKSWSRKEEGVDDWTSDWPSSLGVVNIAPLNHSPIANAGSNITNAKTLETLNFNGSASSDSDGTVVSYEWNFGDGAIASGVQVTHSYSIAGTYQVSLTVHDNGGAISTSSITVTVVVGEIQYQNQYSGDIKIVQIMPNPAGTDSEEEYIKLFNLGSTDINLRNWTLDDEEGGSKPFLIDYDVLLKQKDYLIFYSSDTKLSLNNDGDSVRLYDPDKKLIDNVTYIETATENVPYIYEGGKWAWEPSVKIINSPPEKTLPQPDPKITLPQETKIPDVKKIEVIEPLVATNQSLTAKNEIPKAQTIEEIITASGTLVSSTSAEVNPTIQQDFFSENFSGTQDISQKPYQKPIVILSSMAISLLLITKTLFRPEDWKKILKKLFNDNKEVEVKDDFENLFK